MSVCRVSSNLAVLTLNAGPFASEIGITIINDVNNQVLAQLPEDGFQLVDGTYEVDLCLSDASSYTATLTDAFGDGWNGANFVIETCDTIVSVAEGTILQTYDSLGLATGNDTLSVIQFTVRIVII